MITYYQDIVQGSDEWFAVRCGLLTASEMKLIITPTLKIADNDKTRCHLYELLAQRITNYVEPSYISDDMLRGQSDEVEAKIIYNEKYAPVQDMGFITNDEWGFTLGYSPDGLIGDDGLIECKSRKQKYQIQTMIECIDVECIENSTIPEEYALQIQTGLLVSGRKWCDFISYCGGMHMATIRVLPDLKIQEAIIAAATAFEKKLAEKMDKYRAVLTSNARLVLTERKLEEEMV